MAWDKNYLTELALTEEKQYHVDWRRIYALPHNPYFKDDVTQMRSFLKLPGNGISDEQQAWDWLEKHFKEKRPKTQPWFQQEIPMQSAIRNEKLWKTEIPLWKVAIYLIFRYGIPLRMRSNIGLYLVTNDEKFLTSWRGIDIDSVINVKAGAVICRTSCYPDS